MAIHISARVAWHMDGWNGHICQDPAANTWCIGRHSYPGMKIAEERDLSVEEANRGQSCAKISRDYIPPCVYSINAFGSKELTAIADPPRFFRDGTLPRRWPLPPSTVCVWPYEEMYYAEGVRTEDDSRYDYDTRLLRARRFRRGQPDHSLIFYYANYSNPFSEDDKKRYVLVGLSRVREVGEILKYANCSEETKKKYGGGFIWQCNVTSHYPDQGLRPLTTSTWTSRASSRKSSSSPTTRATLSTRLASSMTTRP